MSSFNDNIDQSYAIDEENDSYSNEVYPSSVRQTERASNNFILDIDTMDKVSFDDRAPQSFDQYVNGRKSQSHRLSNFNTANRSSSTAATVSDPTYRILANTMAKTLNENLQANSNDKKVPTLGEAFRSIVRACEAADDRRYKEALTHYMDGGEGLSSAAENESNVQIQDLLLHKAYEVLSWAEILSGWMETSNIRVSDVKVDKTMQPPIRTASTVAVSINEMSSKNKENLAPSPRVRSNMLYTPVISKNPANFSKDGYVLQCLQESRRPTLTVVITMYNEDEVELASTLRKVANNIEYLQEKKLPGYSGESAWESVLVCIVSDGRQKANAGTLSYLQGIGMFDEDVMNISSTGVDVQLHLFERVVTLTKRTQKTANERVFPPLQLVFALKEHNSGKLNSHLWYFSAIVAQVHPEYTCLLDVGTMPTKSAFYRLLYNMEINKQIGGVCGEIAVDKPIPNLCNLIIAAQHYEYKVSNVLDKSMESCFGYISVLPGAFSAYRYEAIKGKPLDAYFKSLTTPMAELGPFQGNMYLAEDRILAFEILAKKNCNWTMNYVKDAIARTDVPTNLTGLIGQRRRWLNGSFFAMLFGISQWYRVYTESGHGMLRKFFFTIQYLYMVIQTVLSFFLCSAFHLAIYYVVIAGFSNNEWGFVDLKDMPSMYKDLFSALFNGSYGVAMVTLLVLGLGNKPKHVNTIFTIIAIYFAVVMAAAVVIAVLIFCLSKTFTLFQIFFATAILGVYFIASAIHCELHHIVMSFFQYSLMLPTFVNVLMTYSFCNLHDLSWGTKGIDSGGDHGPKMSSTDKEDYDDVVTKKKKEEARKKQEAEEADLLLKRFNAFRSSLLLLWIFSNTSAVGFCIYFVPASKFLPILYVVVGFFNLFRMAGSAAYLLYMSRQFLLLKCLLSSGKLKKNHDQKVCDFPTADVSVSKLSMNTYSPKVELSYSPTDSSSDFVPATTPL